MVDFARPLEGVEDLRDLVQGGAFGVDAGDSDGDTTSNEVAPSSEAELEAAEQEEDKESEEEKGESKDENKDTPHYKLMVLLEQELPECSRREQIDELAEKFCTNHGSRHLATLLHTEKHLEKSVWTNPT